MKWLNTFIEINTDSINISIFLFSILSVICSVIVVLIYFRMKQLRTVIYRFFFHVAINEMVDRLTYLIRFISREGSIFIFRATAFITYFTDTNIIILVTFTCYGMYQLILKQNTKLANQFNKISIFLYSFSLILTIINLIISINDDDVETLEEDTDLYRNIICLFFITDNKNPNEKPIIFTCVVYFAICLYSLFNIILIQIFVKDRANISSNVGGDDETSEDDKKIKSSLKLRTFRLKLLAYPLLNFAYVIPLFAYTWIEYVYLSNKENYDEDMNYYRVRYAFFNIYCFLNSIRGFLFFLVFIMNEKIKKFIFENYLNFEIFKTIDKIKNEEQLKEGSSLNIESDRKDSLEKEMDASFGSAPNKNSKKSKKKKGKNQNNELIELDENPKKPYNKLGLINDDEDNDSDGEDEAEKLERDAKSESMKVKKIHF